MYDMKLFYSLLLFCYFYRNALYTRGHVSDSITLSAVCTYDANAIKRVFEGEVKKGNSDDSPNTANMAEVTFIEKLLSTSVWIKSAVIY